MLPFYSLDRLRGSEVDGTPCDIIKTGNDERTALSSVSARAAAVKMDELR